MTSSTPGRNHLSPLFTWRSAIADSDLPSTSRLVAFALGLHMNERGGSCFPSVQTLARETGLSRSTVQVHLGKLIEAGWLERDVGGGKKSSRYGASIPAREPGSPGDRPAREVTGTRPGAGQEGVIEDVVPVPPSSNEDSGTGGPPATGAQALVGGYVDRCRALGVDPPKRVVGHVARETAALLKEGRAPIEVEAALGLLAEKGLHPSTLPSAIVTVARVRRAPTLRFGRGLTTDEMIRLAVEAHNDEGAS